MPSPSKGPTPFKLFEARGFLIACCGLALVLSILGSIYLASLDKLTPEALQVVLGVFALVGTIAGILGIAKKTNSPDE